MPLRRWELNKNLEVKDQARPTSAEEGNAEGKSSKGEACLTCSTDRKEASADGVEGTREK